MGEHDHLHEQHHTHDETDTLAHIHTHRNIIGFDEHGIPTVIVESGHMEGEADDPQSFIRDYMNAVSEYRKTFPSKQDVIGQTPDPAVRDLLLRMEQLGIDTAFDRFDRQKPQCNYGLAGICCKICNSCNFTSYGDRFHTRYKRRTYRQQLPLLFVCHSHSCSRFNAYNVAW